QRDRDRDQGPEQLRPEVGSRQRIRRDPAGVVVDVRGDDAGPDHREQERELPAAGEAARRDGPAQTRSFFFHASGRTSVRTSSTVIMPTSTPSSSTTGTAAWLYFSITAATCDAESSGWTRIVQGAMTSSRRSVSLPRKRRRMLMMPSS